MKTRILACVAVALLLAGGLTTVMGQGGFTLDLYETVDNTPNGIHTETGPIVPLPQGVVAGWLILLDDAGGYDPVHWSDAVHFFPDPTSGSAFTVQLLSDMDNSDPNPLWPTLAEVLRGPNAFIPEALSGPTVYTSFPNTYNIWSLDEAQIPEPSQIVSGLVVLLFAGGYAGRRAWQRRKQS